MGNIPKINKASSRSETRYLIGLTETGYRVCNPKTEVMSDACNLKIYESEKYGSIVFTNECKDGELVFEETEKKNLVLIIMIIAR